MEEKVLYQNSYELTKKKYLSWGRENAFTGKRRNFAIFWIGMAIVCMGLWIFTKILIDIVLALFCIYRACLHWRMVTSRQYDLLANQHGKVNWTRDVLFYEDRIQITDVEVSVQYKYEDVVGIKESENYIRLLLRNRMMIRLYEDAFVNSNWEECKAYILGKSHIQ
ncbi:hypothetical protein [Anaerosporobacter faecicola]|uniref:hypothetical protein n=1 Tax=Anaerosporobacter faecicola TaxID=2718714 RepID=UPI001439B267|nr:hypothetical protein [Anaerosporobacter faecicola]